jgi:hypothetical protein
VGQPVLAIRGDQPVDEVSDPRELRWDGGLHPSSLTSGTPPLLPTPLRKMATRGLI